MVIAFLIRAAGREELSRFYNFRFIFSVVNGCSIVFRGTRSASQTP